MTTAAHLWAIGYENTERADQVRDEIAELGWGAGKAGKYLLLEDIAVVVRHIQTGLSHSTASRSRAWPTSWPALARAFSPAWCWLPP